MLEADPKNAAPSADGAGADSASDRGPPWTPSHGRSTSSSSLNVPSSLPTKRSASPSHPYKETLDAKSTELADGSRVLNQYRICEEIGKGAYGTVHRAYDVNKSDDQYAIKEFGKTRLRRSHRAERFRGPHGPGLGGIRGGFAARHGALRTPEEEELSKDPLHLIRHELAILKKLDHPYIVRLYEVLDDPDHDSLYMVFDYCAGGRLMDISIGERASAYDEDIAREYFRQILLGIEYLHSHDIVHRDIKPDNILLTSDRSECRIVDFGISEIFEKPGNDLLRKSAGSPAFMSPEICKAKHGQFSGKAHDIWSLGVVLFCMVTGHLPFEKTHILELYDSIVNDPVPIPSELSPELKDLFSKILDKDPDTRIDVQGLRDHPWVTQKGKCLLLSVAENLVNIVKEVTDEEIASSVARTHSIFTVAAAVSKLKKLHRRTRSAINEATGSDHSSSRPSSPNQPSKGAAEPVPKVADELVASPSQFSGEKSQVEPERSDDGGGERPGEPKTMDKPSDESEPVLSSSPTDVGNEDDGRTLARSASIPTILTSSPVDSPTTSPRVKELRPAQSRRDSTPHPPGYFDFTKEFGGLSLKEDGKGRVEELKEL